MKFATSYFYHVRHFAPNMVPISTAVWDPKWFHDFKGQDYFFLDKRGIINGVRAEKLAPGPQLNGLCAGINGDACGHDPTACEFLQGYKRQLAAIGGEYLDDIRQLCEKLVPDEEPVAVLLVHEAYDNVCSERQAIQDWVRSFGYDCNELSF